MIALDTRCRDILMLLLQSQTPLASGEIASQLGITPRMVRYRLRSIERWLQEKSVCLTKKPGCGILIAAPGRVRKDLIRELERLTGYLLLLSPNERLHMLVLSLLTSDQPLLVKQFERQLNVSRTTVLKDLGRVEEWLGKHNLHLIRRPNFGCKIVGKENNRRKAIVGLLLDTVGEMPLLALCEGSEAAFRSRAKGKFGLSPVLCTFLKDLELSYSSKLIASIENILHLQFTDNAHVSIALHLAIMIERAQQGKIVKLSRTHLETLRGRREFHAAKIMAEKVKQQFSIALCESEVAYIAMQVLGAKTTRTITDIIGERNAERIDPEALEIAEGILAEASLYLHPYLRVDQQLLYGLVLHLKPILNRLRFCLPVRNPLLEDVKKHYPYVFKVAQRSSIIIEEKVGRRVPEEELGYIAMHLGAAMERLRPFPRERKRVLVVCPEGIATAWLLVSRIQADFPEIEVVEVMSAREVSRKHAFRGDVDAMISTMPMEIAGIPITVVSPLLGDKDKARIRKVLKIGTPTPESTGSVGEAEEPSLATLITTETIGLRVVAKNWREVVDKAGSLLVDVGAIEARYVEAMKEIIVRYGPYVVIAPGVALLHACPEDGVKKLCMSLVTLQKPVKFGHPVNDPVDLAIALGTVDDHSHLRPLWELVEMLQDQEAISKIRSAIHEREVVDLIWNLSRGWQGRAGWDIHKVPD